MKPTPPVVTLSFEAAGSLPARTPRGLGAVPPAPLPTPQPSIGLRKQAS